MSFTQNKVYIRGYVNYLKHTPMADGFISKFSINLAAGKDKEGNFKNEYMNVQLSMDCSKSNHGKFADSDFVQIEGRIRNISYQKDGQKKTFPCIEAFDLFTLIRKQGGQAQAQAITPPPVQAQPVQARPMPASNPYQPPHNYQQQAPAAPSIPAPAAPSIPAPAAAPLVDPSYDPIPF